MTTEVPRPYLWSRLGRTFSVQFLVSSLPMLFMVGPHGYLSIRKILNRWVFPIENTRRVFVMYTITPGSTVRILLFVRGYIYIESLCGRGWSKKEVKQSGFSVPADIHHFKMCINHGLNPKLMSLRRLEIIVVSDGRRHDLTTKNLQVVSQENPHFYIVGRTLNKRLLVLYLHWFPGCWKLFTQLHRLRSIT